jgi:uncharacterized protein YbjT (DUF2867 family)
MKVLIIGANGKVGKLITQKLKESEEFTPIAAFRKEEQKEHFKNMGVDYRVINLEDEVATIAKAVRGADAIVFSAGSGGKGGAEKTLAVDLDGAVKAMEAARKEGIKRFVIVSAMGTDDRNYWEESGMKTYYIAKHYADRVLKASDLYYTIIRPGALQDKPGTGKITTQNAAAKEGVPREDVANVIVEVLKKDSTIRKIIEFNSGDTAVREAVKTI